MRSRLIPPRHFGNAAVLHRGTKKWDRLPACHCCFDRLEADPTYDCHEVRLRLTVKRMSKPALSSEALCLRLSPRD